MIIFAQNTEIDRGACSEPEMSMPGAPAISWYPGNIFGIPGCLNTSFGNFKILLSSTIHRRDIEAWKS